jgi:hypothetical protein
MRTVNLAVMLLSCFLSFGASAQTVTTGQYRHPNGDKDLNFNKTYLVGIKDGLLAYNMSSEVKLFCMAGTIPVLSFEQANDIVMRLANKKGSDRDGLPLGLALLFGLKETYPCPK